ncbi:hypothetical protein ACFWWA_17190 [Streptomyces goshikiensis]|uniref:hypothetical protein n=1 Tax=Streptomyces goshikiensis TaxID=1942 RepID=UPI003648E710
MSTCVKTLAALAGVTRTGFYPKKNRDGTARPGAYQHLAEEFERRVKELQDAGQIIDPRAAQIERLKKENDELRKRIAVRDKELTELTEFKILAISRLAAPARRDRTPAQASRQRRERPPPARLPQRHGTAP